MMERELGVLRCSKLSCYTEFNRMVQAIVRNGSTNTGRLNQLRGGKGMTVGSSAEYGFYYSLAMMLREIVSSVDVMAQKQELQRVYNWFCLNKPLVKSKTNNSHRKPVLTYSTSKMCVRQRKPHLHDRPQTAPATLHDRPQTAPATLSMSEPFSGREEGVISSLSREGDERRRDKGAFTSSFMSRSLSHELNSVGRSFDQLQSMYHEDQNRKMSAQDNSSDQLNSKGLDSPHSLSVIDLSSVSSLPPAQPRPPSHPRPATVGSVTREQLFKLSASIAAQMSIDQEMRAVKKEFIQRATLAPGQTSALKMSPRQRQVRSPIHKSPNDDRTNPSPEPLKSRQVVSTQTVKAQIELETSSIDIGSHKSADSQLTCESFLLEGRALRTQRHDHIITGSNKMSVIFEEDSSSVRSNSPCARPTTQLEPLAQAGNKKPHLNSEQVSLQRSSPDPQGPGSTQLVQDLNQGSGSLSELPVSPTVTINRVKHEQNTTNVPVTVCTNKKRQTAPLKVTTVCFAQDRGKLNTKPHTQSRSLNIKALRLSQQKRTSRSQRARTTQ